MKNNQYTSIAGNNPFSYTGGIDTPEYACSKAAVNMLTKTMSKSLKGKILVNGISPGATDIGGKTKKDKNLEITSQDSEIKRLITPKEISDTTMFILKNDAINGETIIVDGGTSFQ